MPTCSARPPATASASPTPTSSSRSRRTARTAPAAPATKPSSAAARYCASPWGSPVPPAPTAPPTPSSPAPWSSTIGASSRPTSASVTAGSTGIGKSGNPDTMDGVHPDLVIGPETEVIAGNGKILTAGGIDTHVHFIAPAAVDEALASGITTLIGGGTRPRRGQQGDHRHPGSWHLARMFAALESSPVNIGFLGKGSTMSKESMRDQLRAGIPRLQDPRGLGRHPGRHLRVPGRVRGVRCPARRPHRHPERGRIRRRHLRRRRRPHPARLPRRGRRRRHRTGHDHGGLAAQHAPGVHQPDPAAHRQHRRGAPRHADGLSPPEPRRPRGPGLRGVPHPAQHHRGRGTSCTTWERSPSCRRTPRPWAVSER